ncbi:MAG TPA: MlaD family protein [Acidimicrobiales bacterium]|nr:MlaD family protein [Acidimicrobiales bacterium]
MQPPTLRARQAIIGAISLIVIIGLAVLGVRVANGAWASRYRLTASFDSAGQGLIRQSDVKIRGVDIGRVERVQLRKGRAVVTMSIDEPQKVPVAATATVRPKTLFGEKFIDIDPGPTESSGPYLHDGGRITHTVGAIELEKLLSEAYPILKAINPDELGVVISELATASRGMGPTINRTLSNGAEVLDVQARHDADLRQFLDDLTLLSATIDQHANDLVSTAKTLNSALPPLNDRAGDLTTVLQQAARVSADVADVLEANKPFLDKSVTEGGKSVQLLYDQRGQLPGLIRGLRYFVQVLSEIGRFDLGDGTKAAAVKGVLGGGSVCGRTPVGCPVYAPPVTTPPPGGPPPTTLPTIPGLPPPTLPTIPGVTLPPPTVPGVTIPGVTVPGGTGSSTSTSTTLGLPIPQFGSAAVFGLIAGLLR